MKFLKLIYLNSIINVRLTVAILRLPKVFDMFYKASTFNSGAGLGLFLTKEALRKIKGDVMIQSEQGKGTDVLITIPDLKNIEEEN
jgi:signal transduction histidine kinase